VADLQVDESALSGVASAVSGARGEIGFDTALTRGSSDAVGAARVAEALDETTRQLRRRVEFLGGVLERLSLFPAAFVREVGRTDSALAAGVLGAGGAVRDVSSRVAAAAGAGAGAGAGVAAGAGAGAGNGVAAGSGTGAGAGAFTGAGTGTGVGAAAGGRP